MLQTLYNSIYPSTSLSWTSNSRLNPTVLKTEDGWNLQLDVPGYKESEIKVELNEDRSVLTASGDTEERGPFKFTIPLSGRVSKEVEASLALGVLTLKLKKASVISHLIPLATN